MTSQIIPLLGVASPGYTPEPLRTITVNATREGQQTSTYKEAVLWPSLYDRVALVTFALKDGTTSTRTFAASAVDGKKAVILYDFDDQPYGTVRTPNITADIVLNMDLIDVDSPPLTGVGYLSGNFPLTLLNESSNPSHANVRAIVKHEQYGFNGSIAGTTTVLPNGHWVIDNLNMDLMYDVIAEIPGYNGIIISNVSPDPDYVPPIEEPADPLWDYVISLLHFDNDFTDVVTNKVWLDTADTTISSNAVFGTGALSIASGSVHRLSASHPDFQLGLGDFTIELYAKPNRDTNNSIITVSGLLIYTANGRYYVSTSTSPNFFMTTAGVDLTKYQHLALVRSNGIFYFFIDGAQAGYINFSMNLQDATAFLGAFNAGSRGDGYFDEVRITKGIARYTADFTPPTEPFPNHGIL